MEIQFLKVGPNGGRDPRVDAVAGKLVFIHYATMETELSNVTGCTEGEHSVDEKCKFFEPFVIVRVVVVELENLTMLPQVAPSARNKTRRHGGFNGEE